jgi:hypothetical protein
MKTFTHSFAGGEVSQELFGRFDLITNSLDTCRNFITLPHGPAVNRTGFQYVATSKDSSKKSRVITFSFSNTQTFIIEIGAGYFRWYTQAQQLLCSTPSGWVTTHVYAVGDLVLQGGNNYYCLIAHTSGTFATDLANNLWYAMPANNVYEIPNPFAEADLMDIHYVQEADVITLVHPNYPPQELKRFGATNWQLTTISFNPSMTAPSGVTATPVLAGAVSYSYVVTAISNAAIEESVASSPASCTNDLTITGHSNTIGWGAVTGTIRYNIYKLSNGLYGYIGQASGTSFSDTNIIPDVSRTPPINDPVFSGSGNYPAAVGYSEQRRLFAATNNQPQNLWMTRSATENNMSYSLPSRSDDAIRVKIAAREASPIRHIVPISNIMLFTASCEWRVSSINSDAITPTSISIKPQSYNGANNVSPIVVTNSILYAVAKGGHIREMTYQYQAGGFISSDVSLKAPHLFDYLTITDMAFARAPYPILWAISSNGNLLGMTYVPEQEIAGWHRHDTDGVFESIATVLEGSEDYLYAVIRRTINGSTVRYIERMHSRNFATIADAFHVDSGATYSGNPVTTINGLNWLEGKVVNILADGAVQPQKTVIGGSISLDVAASKVQVGLPIQADIKTIPFAYQDASFGQGQLKNVNRIWLRVYRSGGISAGPSFTKLTPVHQRTTEVYGTPPNLKSDEIKLDISPSWSNSGQVCIRQNDPLPLTISSITIEAATGG